MTAQTMNLETYPSMAFYLPSTKKYVKFDNVLEKKNFNDYIKIMNNHGNY